MTKAEAARILNPDCPDERTLEALLEACRTAVRALRRPEPHWYNPEEVLPEEDVLVLVLASGRPSGRLTLDHCVELARYYSGDGWELDHYPAWRGAAIHLWAPIPDLEALEAYGEGN